MEKDRTCLCGHESFYHEHERDGLDCSRCKCNSLRYHSVSSLSAAFFARAAKIRYPVLVLKPGHGLLGFSRLGAPLHILVNHE